ncbi:NYN domain-containing protein [Nocardioidaceae bacterium]|nr:NYN domain-containing protein [Nocardioidaceae bacterium]
MKRSTCSNRTTIGSPTPASPRRLDRPKVDVQRTQAAALPSYCRGRELHLVDVENLLGGAQVTEDAVRRLRVEFDQLVASPCSPDDVHQVVATSTWHTLAEAAFGWEVARPVFQEGPDGADLALLDAGGWRPEQRFSKVVIGSGDHIFAAYARRLRAAGVEVVVVSRPESLAYELRRAASSVVLASTRELETA